MPSEARSPAASERSALVTGSSSGIGQAITERLLADGWRVHGLDVAAPRIEHARFAAERVDLTDAASTQAAARAVGDVAAFVHAAGVLRVGRLGELRSEDATLMWRLHVDAACGIANVVMPRMMAQRDGRVVLIGSRVAHGKAGRSQYAACKAALIGLARSWAAEAIAAGVTVNVVSPAATQTAMLDDPARKTEPPILPPLGRMIQADEVAALVAYLLSSAAAAITGQEIQICGGASLAR